MPNELQYYADPTTDSGLTIAAKVYNNSGALVGSIVSCPEIAALAIYIGDMPEAPAGIYVVRFFQENELIGQGIIEWDGTQEVNFAKETTSQLIKSNTDLIPAAL